MKLPAIKSVAIAIAATIMGGAASAAVHLNTPIAEPKAKPATETVVANETPAPLEEPTNTAPKPSLPAPTPIPTNQPAPLPLEQVNETPWMQGPSEQEPASSGTNNFEPITNNEQVPWRQGPSDQ